MQKRDNNFIQNFPYEFSQIETTDGRKLTALLYFDVNSYAFVMKLFKMFVFIMDEFESLTSTKRNGYAKLSITISFIL